VAEQRTHSNGVPLLPLHGGEPKSPAPPEPDLVLTLHLLSDPRPVNRRLAIALKALLRTWRFRLVRMTEVPGVARSPDNTKGRRASKAPGGW
jgi:hypothetical protein